MASSDDVVIDYPNRDKASSKATKAVVVLLLLVTAALMAIVTIGGWEKLQGAKILQVAYILLYVLPPVILVPPPARPVAREDSSWARVRAEGLEPPRLVATRT